MGKYAQKDIQEFNEALHEFVVLFLNEIGIVRLLNWLLDAVSE